MTNDKRFFKFSCLAAWKCWKPFHNQFSITCLFHTNSMLFWCDELKYSLSVKKQYLSPNAHVLHWLRPIFHFDWNYVTFFIEKLLLHLKIKKHVKNDKNFICHLSDSFYYIFIFVFFSVSFIDICHI